MVALPTWGTGAADAAKPKPSINTWWTACSEIRPSTSTVRFSADIAEALKADAGSPALKIVRRYLDAANEAFELSVSIHPAGRLTVSTDLKRSTD